MILEENEKDQEWSLYLSYVANPLTEGASFDDFQKKIGGKKQKERPKGKQNSRDKVNIKEQVCRAELVLKGFTPPDKKGGVK